MSDELNILLISSGRGAVSTFLERATGSRHPRIGFIAAAGSPYPETPWMDADREALLHLGCRVMELDLETADTATLDDLMSGLDGVFVAGGNTFALLHHVRRSGFDAALQKHLRRGLAYIGASAGALIMGPDVAPAGILDDATEAPPLTSTLGLGYVDQVPLPHVGSTDFDPALIERTVREFGERFDLRLFTDEQALLWEGGRLVTIPSPGA
jgi:dipeptidase E